MNKYNYCRTQVGEKSPKKNLFKEYVEATRQNFNSKISSIMSILQIMKKENEKNISKSIYIYIIYYPFVLFFFVYLYSFFLL